MTQLGRLALASLALLHLGQTSAEAQAGLQADLDILGSPRGPKPETAPWWANLGLQGRSISTRLARQDPGLGYRAYLAFVHVRRPSYGERGRLRGPRAVCGYAAF